MFINSILVILKQLLFLALLPTYFFLQYAGKHAIRFAFRYIGESYLISHSPISKNYLGPS